MPEISIVIPTRLRKQVFTETINSALKAIEKIDAEIIVINDCVEDKIILYHPKIRVIDNIGRGVSAARNFGAFLAESPLLLFIDNDILITEANVIRTIMVHRSKERIIMNATWVYPPSIIDILDKQQMGRIIKLWSLDSFKNRYTSFNGPWKEELFKANLPFAGFYFSIRKTEFLLFLGFNENNIFGGEEEELSEKITDGNIEYWVDPENIVYHNEYDKVTSYKEWLTRIQLGGPKKAKTGRENAEVVFAKNCFFLMPVNYFLLDHIPNIKVMDRIYGWVLYLQGLILQNRAK